VLAISKVSRKNWNVRSSPRLPTIKGCYRPGAVGEQGNSKLVAMLGLMSKLIRQSAGCAEMTRNVPYVTRLFCVKHPVQGRKSATTLGKTLKGTEHLAKVIADVQFYTGERGESLPETMMSNNK
jgi:hypothetical protein